MPKINDGASKDKANILSDIGSNFFPSSVNAFNFLAANPSKASLTAPIIYKIIAGDVNPDTNKIDANTDDIILLMVIMFGMFCFNLFMKSSLSLWKLLYSNII